MTDFVCELRKRASDFYHGADEFAFYDAKLLRQAANAIEQHEAFRQEVSDAVAKVYRSLDRLIPTDKGWPSTVVIRSALNPFLIAKPDPLVEALCEMDPDTMPNGADADNLRKALAARGLEIREVGQ